MSSKIIGTVFRSQDKHKTAAFYEVLGLFLNEHQHGGPLHYEASPLAEDFVCEIYQASEKFSADAVMVEVSSVEESIEAVAALGVEPKTQLKQAGDTKFIYVTDPDGRDVMLLQKV
jgi:hypothetical protein